MKTVLLHGQNHAGSSCNIGRMFASKVSGPDDVKEFFLPRDLDHHCLGCYSCLGDETACPFWNEKKVILDAIGEADLLIFTTPTYCMRASAPMKAFLDLTFTNWMIHRPKECMFSKKALVISTAAGAGTGTAIRDITNALSYWGVSKIWKYGVAVNAMKWEEVPGKIRGKVDSDVGTISRKIISSGPVHASMKTRFLFSLMRMMQKKGWGASPEEKRYWEDRGWLGKARPWNAAKQI